MSIVAVVVVVVKNSDAQHHVISGYRLGQIQREQRDIVLVAGRIRERDDFGKQGIEQVGSAAATQDRRDHPLLAEHPAGTVRLGHAVGVQEQRVTGPQRRSGLLAGNVEEGRGQDRPGRGQEAELELPRHFPLTLDAA
ncbi:MAG: hypothetical protein ACXVCF_00610 [Isosphaeraceae bacterium]|jgi:hypothetical protein